MMRIKDGGAVTRLIKGVEKIEGINIYSTINSDTAELWINDSLSYVTADELKSLKEEINAALKNMFGLDTE